LIHFILAILSNKNKGYFLIKNITLPQEKAFSQSSICEARQKLSEDIFKDLNKNLILEFEKNKKNSSFIQDHRIFAVDGTKVTLPKNLENGDYKVNNEGAHYPKGLLSCIYNLQNYIIHDFCLKSSLNERTPALEYMEALRKNDIVIFDRGYFNYYMLRACFEQEIHPIFRLQMGLQNKEVEDFIAGNQDDKIIEYTPCIALRRKGLTQILLQPSCAL
jgi:hypothetical protein